MAIPQIIQGTSDIDAFIAAGMNPRTGRPTKLEDCSDALMMSLRKAFRVIDEQDAVNRYVWHNLPHGLTSQMMERILYYRGQAIFFYIPELDQFYFLPYTKSGSIDVYGRYMTVTPLKFGSGVVEKDGKERPWIEGLLRDPAYDIVPTAKWTPKAMDMNCVIVSDYTPQLSQKIISRSELQDPLINLMSEIVPYSRTALLNSTGVNGVRVPDEDSKDNVDAANSLVRNAALAGKRYIPITSTLEFQDLANGPTLASEEFLINLQALDNLRLSHLGLSNGGLFQKKSHMLEAEQQMNMGRATLVLQDGLTNRQTACDIINSIFGLGIWCELSETVIGADQNLDGQLVENTDGSMQEQANNETIEEVTEDE